MPDSRASLPPIPDTTGHPRPPAAPLTAAEWEGAPIRRHHPPAPATKYQFGGPDEPALESVYPRQSEAWRQAFLGSLLWGAILLPFGVLAAWLGLALSIGVWLLVVVVALVVLTGFVYLNETFPPAPIVAGAHWVGGRGTRHAARLYELSRVTIHVDAEDPTPNMILTDVHGTRVGMDPSLLESHPELWALVYNGIRHSVAAGAETDEFTSERLLLFDAPPQPGGHRP